MNKQVLVKNIQTSPELANIELGEVQVTYSKHARERAQQKRIRLSQYVQVVKNSVVEVEIEARTGKTVKLVVRERYTDTHDRVLVLVEDRKKPGSIYVKTVWLNHVEDNHSTLDLKRIA